MSGRPSHRSNNLLGTKRLTEALKSLAGTHAEWFMTAEYPLPRGSGSPALALVAWQDGHELDPWPLHAMTYGSLVSQLVSKPSGPFAIPHAEGFVYDEYAELDNRLAEARQGLAELIPPFNALQLRMSRTEHTAGLSANQVRDWLSQAEKALAVSKGRELWQLIREVGPPRFAMHSILLSELLPEVQRGTSLLINFLADSLPPSTPAAAGEAATQAVRESKWDWNELKPHRGWSLGDLSWSDLAQKKFDYLPEYEIVESPSGYRVEEKVPNPGISSSTTQIPLPPEKSVRSQLLKIRKSIDNLLADSNLH